MFVLAVFYDVYYLRTDRVFFQRSCNKNKIRVVKSLDDCYKNKYKIKQFIVRIKIS